ncbi:MAG: glutamine synthetase [Actinobacteria bacterium]|nr:glutamine synthetase [Actinomycetota bacterium]
MSDDRLAFVATNDLVALTRGRGLPSADLSVTSGVGWVPADLAINSFGHLVEPNPFGALGDLRLIPDPKTKCAFPLPGGDVDFYLADQTLPDGSPWECCPRTNLKQALARLLADHRLSLTVAFEHEFALLDATDRQAGPGAFTIGGLTAGEPFGSRARRNLNGAGIEWENWLPEYGPGQFEVTVRPSDALRAADAAVLTREIIRESARQEGLRATFAPLLDPNAVGNGVHVHMSLWRDGQQMTFDVSGPAGLSPSASQACAGILTHTSALLAWTAPSRVSFLRLTPHRWSSAGAFVGLHNREALLRVSPMVPGDTVGRTFNIEYRAADATANPHLVLAALVHAMCDGLERAAPIDRVLTGHIDDEVFDPLPPTVDAAHEAFLADEIAQSWFADDLVTTAAAVRRGEEEHLAGLSEAERCRAYAEVL